MVVGGDPIYLKFWVNQPPLERSCRFWTALMHPAARSLCDSWATCLKVKVECQLWQHIVYETTVKVRSSRSQSQNISTNSVLENSIAVIWLTRSTVISHLTHQAVPVCTFSMFIGRSTAWQTHYQNRISSTFFPILLTVCLALVEIVNSSSLTTIKSRLKSHFFTLAFN